MTVFPFLRQLGIQKDVVECIPKYVLLWFSVTFSDNKLNAWS